MHLSEQQKRIVKATEDKIVVTAAAASGKTHTLVERIKYNLKKDVDPKKIVIITFTNYAANEISERLKNKDVFVGTIHSYANYLLVSKGYYTKNYLEAEEFDKLFEMIKLHPDCIREVEYLYLDEAQDSNLAQFEFLLERVRPKNYMLIGDWRQSIYRWNGAAPTFILNLKKRPEVKSYELMENYRNDFEILLYAKEIIRLAGIDYLDHSLCMSDDPGEVEVIDYSLNEIVGYIKRYDTYKDWFVLCRTNEQVETISNFFLKSKIPYSTFKKSHFTNNQIKKLLQEDTVKILTIHAAKGLESKNVIVIGANLYNEEEKCISYVAATRAKNRLIWVKRKKRNKKNIEEW